MDQIMSEDGRRVVNPGRQHARASMLRRRREEGATLVEFAIILPVLFLIVFGIIEFGWAYFQQLDVRHGAREGVRLAAVNADPANGEGSQGANLARETCNRMDQGSGDPARVTIIVDRTIVAPTTESNIGDEVEVTVTKPLTTLTGFLDFAIGGIDLESSVRTRVEQSGTYSDVVNFQC